MGSCMGEEAVCLKVSKSIIHPSSNNTKLNAHP